MQERVSTFACIYIYIYSPVVLLDNLYKSQFSMPALLAMQRSRCHARPMLSVNFMVHGRSTKIVEKTIYVAYDGTMVYASYDRERVDVNMYIYTGK